MALSLIALALLLHAGGLESPPSVDPLTRPMTVEQAREWLEPRTPARIYGSSYFVGFGGLSVVLIDTGDGLILIDGGLSQAAAGITANVEELGFHPRDIRYILSTEPHFDHAGGLAELARNTGATVIASERGAEGLRSGRLAQDDPQLGYDSRFAPVERVKIVEDREALQLGDTIVIALATPGHTMGSMSWSWRACEAGDCRTMVFAASLNPVAAEGYRYVEPTSRPILEGFNRSYEVLSTVPCDILVTAHRAQGADATALKDHPDMCRTYVANARRALAARLKRENIDPIP